MIPGWPSQEKWRAARVLVAQRIYIPPEGSARANGIVTPALRSNRVTLALPPDLVVPSTHSVRDSPPWFAARSYRSFSDGSARS